MRFDQTGEVLAYLEKFHEELAGAYTELGQRIPSARSRMLLDYMSSREAELAEEMRRFIHGSSDPALKEWDPFNIDDSGIRARIKQELNVEADADQLLGLGFEVLAWLEGQFLRMEAKSGTPEQKALFVNLRERTDREKHKLARNSNMLMDF